MPIPTFALLPSTSELLALTVVLAPIAVALLRALPPTFAPYPSAVFCVPVVLPIRLFAPTAVLRVPVVVALSELDPIPVFEFSIT